MSVCICIVINSGSMRVVALKVSTLGSLVLHIVFSVLQSLHTIRVHAILRIVLLSQMYLVVALVVLTASSSIKRAFTRNSKR